MSYFYLYLDSAYSFYVVEESIPSTILSQGDLSLLQEKIQITLENLGLILEMPHHFCCTSLPNNFSVTPADSKNILAIISRVVHSILPLPYLSEQQILQLTTAQNTLTTTRSLKTGYPIPKAAFSDTLITMPSTSTFIPPPPSSSLKSTSASVKSVFDQPIRPNSKITFRNLIECTDFSLLTSNLSPWPEIPPNYSTKIRQSISLTFDNRLKRLEVRKDHKLTDLANLLTSVKLFNTNIDKTLKNKDIQIVTNEMAHPKQTLFQPFSNNDLLLTAPPSMDSTDYRILQMLYLCKILIHLLPSKKHAYTYYKKAKEKLDYLQTSANKILKIADSSSKIKTVVSITTAPQVSSSLKECEDIVYHSDDEEGFLLPAPPSPLPIAPIRSTLQTTATTSSSLKRKASIEKTSLPTKKNKKRTIVVPDIEVNEETSITLNDISEELKTFLLSSSDNIMVILKGSNLINIQDPLPQSRYIIRLEFQSLAIFPYFLLKNYDVTTPCKDTLQSNAHLLLKNIRMLFQTSAQFKSFIPIITFTAYNQTLRYNSSQRILASLFILKIFHTQMCHYFHDFFISHPSIEEQIVDLQYNLLLRLQQLSPQLEDSFYEQYNPAYTLHLSLNLTHHEALNMKAPQLIAYQWPEENLSPNKHPIFEAYLSNELSTPVIMLKKILKKISVFECLRKNHESIMMLEQLITKNPNLPIQTNNPELIIKKDIRVPLPLHNKIQRLLLLKIIYSKLEERSIRNFSLSSLEIKTMITSLEKECQIEYQSLNIKE